MAPLRDEENSQPIQTTYIGPVTTMVTTMNSLFDLDARQKKRGAAHIKRMRLLQTAQLILSESILLLP
jgi:hypothetical protein